MCRGELKAICVIIKGECDALTSNYDENVPVCEICLKRLEFAVELLRQAKNKTVDNEADL